MPRGDGTGPAGQGPATGRGAGYCAGVDQPGFTTAGYGLGRGRLNRRAWGRDGGRGQRSYPGPAGDAAPTTGGWIDRLIELLAAFRNEYDADETPQRDAAGDIQSQIDDLRRRIDQKLEEQ